MNQFKNIEEIKQTLRDVFGYEDESQIDILAKRMWGGELPSTDKEFSRSELVRFGNFLLSDERRETFSKVRQKGFSLKQRLAEVHHADVENFICLLNSEQGDAVSDTSKDDSSTNADNKISIEELRERFFKECTPNGTGDLYNKFPPEVFEWFKPYLSLKEK